MTLRERVKKLARDLDNSAVSEVPTQTMAADLFELLSDTENETRKEDQGIARNLVVLDAATMLMANTCTDRTGGQDEGPAHAAWVVLQANYLADALAQKCHL